LSILATDKNEKLLKNFILIYTFVTIFVALFGAIYECFSHGVYSYYMIYAFAYPLVMGVVPYMIIAFTKTGQMPGKLSFNLYNSGIATLTIGSIVEGILKIYGTENAKTFIYWIVGIQLVLIGVLLYLIGTMFEKNKKN